MSWHDQAQGVPLNGPPGCPEARDYLCQSGRRRNGKVITRSCKGTVVTPMRLEHASLFAYTGCVPPPKSTI